MSELKHDMVRHRVLVQTIAATKSLMQEPEMAKRVQFFGLERLQAQAKVIEIKLLVQVPDNFVQNLIDQTFLK